MADIQNISKIKTPAGEHELNSKYWNGKEITDVKTINGESIFDSGDINTNLVEITYLELKKLRNNSKLIPGMRYRITDYNATTIQENTMSVNNPFDIIVTAIDTNTLSEDAKVSYSNRDEEIITSRVYTWKDINNWNSGGGNNVPSEISSVTNVLSHQLGTTSYAANEYVRVEFVGSDQYSNPIKALGVALYQNGTLIDGEYGPKKAYYIRIPSSGTYALYFYACGVNSDLTLGQCGVVVDKCSKIPYYYKNMLNNWDIKYSLDNDTERFAWADRINGKGVIHYMKDEFGNEAYYDFKNIKFNCSVFENYPFEYAYTFSDLNGNDLSLSSAAHENKINPYVSSRKQILNHTIFIGGNIHSNELDENNYKNIIWVNGCYYNNIGNSFQNNNIASQNSESLISFHNNVIGSLFKNNRIRSEFNRNYVGNTTTSCDFFAPFVFNEIGNNSYNIDFNYPVSYCKFGSYIQYCVFNNTAQYQPSVSEMKWCTIGDSLEGAQYIPCCQKVTFEDRVLYNSSANWHINDVVLNDGTKLVEQLVQQHEDQLYVCSVNDGCTVFRYKNTVSEINLGTFDSIESVTSKAAEIDICSNQNITRMSFKIDSDGRRYANGFIEQFITGGPYTVNNTELYYIAQTLYFNGETSSRQIVYKFIDGVKTIHGAGHWYKIIDHDNYNVDTPVLYSRNSEVVTVDRPQTITGNKRFDSDINLSGKTLIRNGSNIDAGELKVFNMADSSAGFTIRTNGKFDNNVPILEMLATNNNDAYKYQFPQLANTTDPDFVVVKSQLDDVIDKQQTKFLIIDCANKSKSILIKPNTYYKIINVNGIQIGFDETDINPNILNNYMFEITFDNENTSLGLPNTLKWANGNTPYCERGCTYQISIIGNLGVFTKFN